MGEKSGKLSERQVDIICYIEQTFWTSGAIPTDEKIVEELGVHMGSLKKDWKDPVFRSALSARGVDFSPERSKGLLTAVQLTLANSLLNMHDKRSTREKLKELNITSQQYNAWLATPAFRNYLAQRGEQMFGAHDHEAYQALLSTATGGDVQGLKLFFEMRGIYNPKVNVEVNVSQILGQVIEIITRHVTDPGILAAIADDLERLDSGGRRAPVQQQALPVVATVDSLANSLDNIQIIDTFSTDSFST